MSDVATSRVLYEMFWDAQFSRRVYQELTPDAFEGRAAIAAVISDHDKRHPQAPAGGVDRVLSIVAVFHEHAGRAQGWRRQQRQWKAAGGAGPGPVNPYRSVTALAPGQLDPALLARAGTMMITGEVVRALSVDDQVLKVSAQDSLMHLAARHGGPRVRERSVPRVGACAVDVVAGADVKYGMGPTT